LQLEKAIGEPNGHTGTAAVGRARRSARCRRRDAPWLSVIADQHCEIRKEERIVRRGTEVRPQRWSRVIDLYDDGVYSAIWGSYDGGSQRCLGVRWNGNDTDEPYGYPSQGGHPLWYVEYDPLVRPILCALLAEVSKNKSLERRDEYQRNLLVALSECP